jgi:hypothetical protein
VVVPGREVLFFSLGFSRNSLRNGLRKRESQKTKAMLSVGGPGLWLSIRCCAGWDEVCRRLRSLSRIHMENRARDRGPYMQDKAQAQAPAPACAICSTCGRTLARQTPCTPLSVHVDTSYISALRHPRSHAHEGHGHQHSMTACKAQTQWLTQYGLSPEWHLLRTFGPYSVERGAQPVLTTHHQSAIAAEVSNLRSRPAEFQP